MISLQKAKASDQTADGNRERGLQHILTVREFAERMRVSLPTAYAMTEQAGFPLIRVGKKKLIPTELLDEWIRKQTKGA